MATRSETDSGAIVEDVHRATAARRRRITHVAADYYRRLPRIELRRPITATAADTSSAVRQS